MVNMMITKVPLSELKGRMERFRQKMNESCPEWELVIIFSKVNMYYFTGTMQDGMLMIPREEEPVLWVRRSLERALDESLFPDIRGMNSFRDAAMSYRTIPRSVHMEMETVPMALYQRLTNYFPFREVYSADRQIGAVRSVKSEYEIKLMEKAGSLHRYVLEDLVPGILREGMSEAELAAELYTVMVKEGHFGIARFNMFDTEISPGHIAFGESSIYPTYFNGPGGNYGLSPYAPILGSRERRLRKGDLVFVDVGFGYEGYYTDKTMTYMFGQSLPDEAVKYHLKCVEIQNTIASMLKPGANPAEIYNTIMKELDEEFLMNFMGYGTRKVKFLGHGIGLHIDEHPVIAEGFSEPIKPGMAFAVEPKYGVTGIGMVGIENTFLVEKDGSRCLTGSSTGLIPVY